VHETFKGREATKHLAVSDRMFHERLVAIGGNRDQLTTPTALTGSRYARGCYMLAVRVAVLLAESPAGSAILNSGLAPSVLEPISRRPFVTYQPNLHTDLAPGQGFEP
jgi:hypothetical protein